MRPTALALTLVVSSALPAIAGAARVPAEWEPQEAVWMQWPFGFESSYRSNFADIIDAIEDYETVRLIVKNSAQQTNAEDYLTDAGVPLGNIEFFVQEVDNAWMRDNGPVWVEHAGQQWVQDFRFDGWGGQVPQYDDDDEIPCFVADLEGVGCLTINALITERGGLEFNGAGTLIAAWPWLHDRNPWLTQAQAEAGFAQIWGITEVVWLEEVPSSDFTGGHVDGIARFIDEDTVVVSRYADQTDPAAAVYESAAEDIAAAGLDVIRLDVPGDITYFGFPMAANYVNWLVANDVVVVTGFDHPAWDDASKAAIEGFFPTRDVIVVDAREIWSWGGGVHCVTNDQPAAP